MSTTTSPAPELIAERKARKLLRVTLLLGIVVILVGFAAAVYRLRREAFNRLEWDKGRGMLTSSNPRLRMQKDVQYRLQAGMTRKQVLDFLGPPDPFFAVNKLTGGTSQPYEPVGSLVYMLGVYPRRMTSPPMLMFMVVNFGPSDTVQYSGVDGMPFEPGDKLVPAKPQPRPTYGSPVLAKAKKLPTKGKPGPSKAKPAGP